MISVSPLVLLFLIQFLLICTGLTIFFCLQYRKVRVKEIIARGEANRLRDEIDSQEKDNRELSGFKDMFNSLQEKFAHIRDANAKFKKTIAMLIPEAEKSREFEQLMTEIEQNNKELDTCIGTLQKENEQLDQQSKTFERDISRLSQTLEQSVRKEEYDSLKSQKKSLELKLGKLKKDLEGKTKEHESLQKNYLWLEKEYNALYSNVNEENSRSA